MNNVMEELINSFNTLEPMQQMFWGCAGIATLLFLIQFLLTLLGMDHTDMDVDFDGSNTRDLGNGLNIFSMKNLVNFIMGFGWAGVCLNDVIRSPFLLVSVAFLVGLSFVAMFVFLYMKTRRLETNGAFNINDCLGRTAQVYLRIPAGGQGKGKIQISLNGSVQEFDAITEEDEIPSGITVKITEVMEGEILKVVNVQNNLVI